MKDLGFTSGGLYVVKTMAFFDEFNSFLGISMTIVSIPGRSIVILSLTSYFMSLLTNMETPPPVRFSRICNTCV